MSKIDGVTAKHAIITPNCRVVQGGEQEAFDVAEALMRATYMDILARYATPEKQPTFHVVLTVDWSAS